ncbi:hypothetical protein M406DRAFT_66647 [Cryphonectria parasitica EP155]|uniref:Uncharacterized protein n=1 Tax=Cryphonectria parasitica (strain ATCC 38755 / EP155) TaxID=660469 RepID=A0A9P5CUP8_CRYP1|nr:uncharacterized protein M406DRAFT_66647 [Cryphonectria parasitica EP155]KAF3770225.1 hypothetical protein M406DRAFT_66647 [Cryphonectria parasitica EP155]
MSPRSQSRSVSCDSIIPHEWTAFEIRTLICLIIKGEHEISPEPIDFATKLNKALNPRQADKETVQEHFNRDIPVYDVQEMLQRILSKKKHAVDVSERHPTTVVTKAKIQAFVRSLDFDGSEEEWDVMGRKERAVVERSKMRARLETEKKGGELSPCHQDEKSRRRAVIEDDPNAQRLLAAWGMGSSFWEDPPQGIASQTQGQVYPDHWTPGFEYDSSAIHLGNGSSAATSFMPAAEDDSYLFGPETPRGYKPAGTPLDMRTPTWNGPLAREVPSIDGGWMGGFTPGVLASLPGLASSVGGTGYGVLEGGYGAAHRELPSRETSGQGADARQSRYNNDHNNSKWCGY